MIARKVIITGRVQGVAFRAWTRDQAQQHDVSGWVLNRADGAVEAVLSGDEISVDAMIKKLRKGQLLAKVESLQIAETDPPDDTGFEIRR